MNPISILRRVNPRLQGFPFALLLACLATAIASTAMAQSAQGGAQTSSPTQSSSPSTPAASPFANQAILYPGEDFTLSPGDLILVHLFGSAEYAATVRLGMDGTVPLPYIGSIQLKGLSVRMAQTRIEDALRNGEFYRNPEITIQVLDTVNGSVQITGEIRANIPVATQRSLREVLLAAGGLPASASHTVKIVRPGISEPIVVDLGVDLAASAAADIPVHPNDIIQVTRASVVYVLGAFAHQGSYPLDQASPLTLLQLAALSGGINYEGSYDDLRLVRTVGKERKVVKVDIKKVRDGKAPDPVLEANDIVFLPTSQMKAALKSLGVGGVLGFVSLLITIRNSF